MKETKQVLKNVVIMILVLTLLCGIIYPLLITAIAQILFKEKADGSIIKVNGVKYGCEQLAQEFTSDQYMWGRIMIPTIDTYKDEDNHKLYYAGPSNISPVSEEYQELIKERVEKIKNSTGDIEVEKIPVDLVTCSGSGLDPDISLKAAKFQIKRIAESRNKTEEEVAAIIDRYTSHKFLGIFGEDTVNVLKVNLALDGII